MIRGIAKNPKEYCCIVSPAFKRNRTRACESEAITVVRTYQRYGQITEEKCKETIKEIKAAPHDDAISSIMTKLRKRVYG